jgi:Ankyrin repeats (3 copies)
MPRIKTHAVDCGCCVPRIAAQNLDELEFSRSCCHAASSGDVERVQALIKKHPECIHSDGTPGCESGYTPLHYASRAGHLAIVKVLIEAGAAVNASTTAGGGTPLHRAAYAGHADVVEVLLQSGAAVDLEDADGQTAVYKATQQGHLKVAELLQGWRRDSKTSKELGSG